MLTVSEEFFRSDEVAEIKVWLSHKGAGLFRRSIQEAIAKNQVQASNDMLRGMEPGTERFKADAEAKLRRVQELNVVLKELDRAASTDFQPSTVRVATV